MYEARKRKAKVGCMIVVFIENTVTCHFEIFLEGLSMDEDLHKELSKAVYLLTGRMVGMEHHYF